MPRRKAVRKRSAPSVKGNTSKGVGRFRYDSDGMGESQKKHAVRRTKRKMADKNKSYPKPSGMTKASKNLLRAGRASTAGAIVLGAMSALDGAKALDTHLRAKRKASGKKTQTRKRK